MGLDLGDCLTSVLGEKIDGIKIDFVGAYVERYHKVFKKDFPLTRKVLRF